MNIAVILCTIHRPAVLHQTVLSVRRQALAPVQIIVCSPGSEHLLPETLALPGVEWVQSAPGLATQRNRALASVAANTDLVAFLDDDIELSRFYLAAMARLFCEQPRVVLASGRLLYDGGRGARIESAEARTLCETYDRRHDSAAPPSWKEIDSGYGCNMVVRSSELCECRFDENLPLYAWLEDRDFSHRCTRGKLPPVELANAAAVHLGWRSGRVSGVRLGFSTVVNPVYLQRKTRMFSPSYIVVHYWLRCLAGNILGILTRDRDYDRWGLLKGNLLGYWHLLTGNCNPQYILRL